MARPMTADQTLAAMRKWKVPFKEYPGWRTRTRPGGLTEVYGILEHHTGGSGQSDDYLKFLFVTGRPEDGIPGPLCNVSTDAKGILHLGAIGRANHAGSGSQAVMDLVKAEDYSGYTAELKPGPDGVNGNPHYYGNELMYTGTVAPSAAMYRTATLHAAAVCDFHGWSALSAIGHREHTRRKSDPGKFTMNKFRSDVAALLKAGPPKPTTPAPPAPPKTAPLENEVTLDELMNAQITGKAADGSTKSFGTFRGVLWTLMARTADDDSRMSRIETKLNDLAAKLPKQ